MERNAQTEVRITDDVVLLRAPNEPARVYLVAVGDRIAIVACVKSRIAGAGTQWEVGE